MAGDRDGGGDGAAHNQVCFFYTEYLRQLKEKASTTASFLLERANTNVMVLPQEYKNLLEALKTLYFHLKLELF